MIEQSGCSQLRIPGGDWRNCPSDLAGELLERRYGPEEGAGWPTSSGRGP